MKRIKEFFYWLDNGFSVSRAWELSRSLPATRALKGKRS